MLFNIENDFIISNCGKEETKDLKVLKPKEALILGNLFYDMYEPYKNYKPRELVAKTAREKELLKIQELALSLNDLNLYLDVNPHDYEAYYLFKIYAKELNHCTEKYNEEYQVLEVNFDINNEYSWYKSPWPWEGDKNV